MTGGAEVWLWGVKIGTVIQEADSKALIFEYDKNFLRSNIQVSPLMMPLNERQYSFPRLNEETYHGLPGLLADSLPDKFGTRIINDYLVKQGRELSSITPIERLCYMGTRGMGALEFRPQIPIESVNETIDIDELAHLAEQILSERKDIRIKTNDQAIKQLIQVGTSAGGARAKALIAWNESTGEIRSGQINAGEGYNYWLLKFGTVSNNKDKDKENDHTEYPKIEYAYSFMAKDCGIEMTECRLIQSEEGCHFATKRFDREEYTGRKIHMQSLCGLAHFDFNDPGAHSYEEVAKVFKRLGFGNEEVTQLFRRMVFNEVAKNYDDHTKNIAFLMNREGHWSLAPAFDLTFTYNPNSIWTSSHQMKINGKKDNLSLDDLLCAGITMGLKKSVCQNIIKDIVLVVKHWEDYAKAVGLDNHTINEIKTYHRFNGLFPGFETDMPYLDALQSGQYACAALSDFEEMTRN